MVYRVAAPVKNCETGEFCEDIVSIKRHSSVNDETGEFEQAPKNSFKVPIPLQRQPEKPHKNYPKITEECNFCIKGRNYFVLILVTLTFLLPPAVLFLYFGAESLLHSCSHKHDNNKPPNFRSLFHKLFYSQFCGFCQAKRSMYLVGKLQDERLAKMRKYVKTIPIQ